MSPHSLIPSIQLTPSPEERQIISLLLMVGEQFDEFKDEMWKQNGCLTKYTIFNAIHKLQEYMKLSDYVPKSHWPLCIDLAFDFKCQLDKLIDSLGSKRVEMGGRYTVNDLIRVGHSNHFTVKVGELIHTMFRTSDRVVIMKNSLAHLSLKSAVQQLSQPSNSRRYSVDKEYIIKQYEEDPCLSSRPLVRRARVRRLSAVELEDPNAIELKNFVKRAQLNDDAQKERSAEIFKDVAFKDYEERRFIHFCRQKVSFTERWKCSDSLRHRPTNILNSKIKGAHTECNRIINAEYEAAGDYYLSEVNKIVRPRFRREFDGVVPVRRMCNNNCI